jgi:hypothetical protein
MPYCTSCGRKCLRDEDKFCYNCGAELHHHAKTNDPASDLSTGSEHVSVDQSAVSSPSVLPNGDSRISSPLNISGIGHMISPVLSLRHTHRHSHSNSHLRSPVSLSPSFRTRGPSSLSSSPNTVPIAQQQQQQQQQQAMASSFLSSPSFASVPRSRNASVNFTQEQKQYLTGDSVVGVPEYMPAYCVQCRNVFDLNGNSDIGTKTCYGQFRRRHPGQVGRSSGCEPAWTCCGSAKLDSSHCPRHNNHLSSEWMPGLHSQWNNRQANVDAFVVFE